MVSAISNEGWLLKTVVMVPPEKEYFSVDDMNKHNFVERANREMAITQHGELRNLLRNLSVRVVEVPELAGHPNSVFTMDTALPLGDSFIVMRMGIESRRGEEEWMAKVLESMGLVEIGKVVFPGTAEGGDLIPAYPYFFAGRSKRTNREGLLQISKIVERYGYEFIQIDVPEPHLHLGGAMSMVDEDTILACENIDLPNNGDLTILRIKCKSFISGNVINVGNGKIIVEKRNHEAQKILKDAGFTTIAIDLSEFVKGYGGPSCLILPVLRQRLS